MAAKKKGKTAKRYSPSEKENIISFVNDVNAKKGRGGVTAAAKKFKVSPLSISNWIKKEGGGAKKPGRKPAGRKPAAKGGVWEQMVALKSEIEVHEQQAAAKRAKFDKLKKKL